MIETKLELNPEKAQETEYPYIGIYTGDEKHVVLFTAKKTGTVLQQGEWVGWKVGEYCDNWAEDEYVKLSGSITLTQE